MQLLRSVAGRFSIMGELLGFFWSNKWWWVTPMLIVLLLFGVVVALAQIPAIAPFIYTLF